MNAKTFTNIAIMKPIFFLVIVFILFTQISWAGRAQIDTITNDPYVSALVVDADTGKTLFEDHASAVVYPASVLKLMVLLVVLERIEQKSLGLDEMVQITNEAAQMGGSQVYLDPKEQFSVEELLYALMIQSANDAAVALANHVAGSKKSFVSIMNQRAAELGMKDTQFHSVHGLPPAEGQKPDKTSAIDLSILSRELASKPETFKYTGTVEREFRDGTFIMRTHNHLLKTIDGCDGFKTGYFKAAGFSIVATAKRNGVRIIAIVLGSKDRKVRDAKASELLARGFALVPPKTKAVTIVSNPDKAPVKKTSVVKPVPEEDQVSSKENDTPLISSGGLLMFGLGFGSGVVFCALVAIYRSSRNRHTRRRRIF